MKFCFESHEDDREIYIPISADRYEVLISTEEAFERIKLQMIYDYRHDNYEAYKDGIASYKPLEVLQMMGLTTVADRLEGERKNAAENQKSKD